MNVQNKLYIDIGHRNNIFIFAVSIMLLLLNLEQRFLISSIVFNVLVKSSTLRPGIS